MKVRVFSVALVVVAVVLDVAGIHTHTYTCIHIACKHTYR